jgi:hypothetical protein
MINKYLMALFICLFISKASGQDSMAVYQNNCVSTWKMCTVAGLTAGAFALSYGQQSKEYWKTPVPFYSMNWDMEYNDALLADKLGHLYFTDACARIYRGFFEWAGSDSLTSQWLGSGVALAFQTFVEIQDGKSGGEPYLGFSRGDMLANISGAAFPLLQMYIPPLDLLRWKISYNASERFNNGGNSSITTDYESTYHWLSLNVYQLIPKSWQSYWTPLLNVAIGHSVKALDRQGGGTHELWLSLDLNTEALPGDSDFLKAVKRSLNIYKLPMPAIRILPGMAWYGLRL